MDNKEIRWRRFLEAHNEHGGTLLQFAIACGETSANYFSQLKNRTRNIGDKTARAIEAALSKPYGWMDVAEAQSEPAPSWPYAEVIHIPYLSPQPSAGAAKEPDADEYCIGTYPIFADQVAELGLDSRDLVAVRVRGKSMERTIMDGARVIVDRGSKRPRDGVVYAIQTADGPIVKRLRIQPFGGGVIAASDNSDHKDIEMAEGDVAQIIGRVVLAINPIGTI